MSPSLITKKLSPIKLVVEVEKDKDTKLMH
jgi:hypothetical protein